MNGFVSRHLDFSLLPRAMAFVRARARPRGNHTDTEVVRETADYTMVDTIRTTLTVTEVFSSPLSDESNGSLTHGAT